MFIYCGNNPINRCDPSGLFWKEIGNALKKAWRGITKFCKSTFGSGNTVIHQEKQEIECSPPIANLLFSVKNGTKEKVKIRSTGNTSKPISVYSKARTDNILLSSAGLKINISSFTLDLSLGLDNIGLSGSIRKGNTTSAFGLTADLSQLKIGFEDSVTIKWDENTDITEYYNASFTGSGIASAIYFAVTRQYIPTHSY